MNQRILIVGNWKMHGTIGETLQRITVLHRDLEGEPAVDIVLAPPFTSLYSASIALQDVPMKLAAQNLHWESEGAYTGEVSGPFLKDVGCDYAIVGHSERRHCFGEDDETINKKVRSALAAELKTILCIGETAEERKAGKTFERLEGQLAKDLSELHIHDIEGLSLAYEPVWAIGTGQNATPEQVGEVHSWIRNYIAKTFDAPTANTMRLLYGGSVKKDNAATLLKVQHVDGLLVGGASLDPEEFMAIIQAATA